MGNIDHAKIQETLAGSRGGTGWRPKAGDNRIRILPPFAALIDDWSQLRNVAVHYRMHYFKIEGRQTDVSLCLEERKQACPACQTWRAHRKSTDPGLEKLADEVKAADTYLLNILDINNLAGGIQKWASNWTCWHAIMEIVGNTLWGNVIDPANGIDFIIKLTPAAQSRTGYNAYGITPIPERTNVMPVLESIQGWRDVIDSLADQIIAPKEPQEIESLLQEMGFPPKGGQVAGAPRPSPTPTPTPAPLPAAGPVPVASAPPVAQAPPTPVAAPAVQAVPTPIAVPAPTAAPTVPAVVAAPTPVAAAPAPPTPVAAAVAPPQGVHYDPGPQYVSKVADAERPQGAPRCFGDYEPKQHNCQPCPQLTACQMWMLNH